MIPPSEVYEDIGYIRHDDKLKISPEKIRIKYKTGPSAGEEYWLRKEEAEEQIRLGNAEEVG